MRPLIADNNELTVLRSLAAFSYGTWGVEWPDSVPENQRPSAGEGRKFGYASQSERTLGRMGRRFVRADVSVRAHDVDEKGQAVAFSGSSDVEITLDAAAKKTDGDVFVERDITRAGLNGNTPYVDFDVGDIVPVLVWGKTLELPVTSIEAVTEAGAVVDWRIHVGGQLLFDDVARERHNVEVERAIAQERRERLKDVGEVTTRVTAAQNTADAVRVDFDALKQRFELEAKTVADSISKTVTQANFDEYSSDLQKKLWGAQGEFNQISAEFQNKQSQINAQQQQINQQQARFNQQQQQINDALTSSTNTNARMLSLLSIQNHGALYMTKAFILPAKKDFAFEWQGQRGQMMGCHSEEFNDGGTFIRFDSLGDWQIYARVDFPSGDTIIGTSTRLDIHFNDGLGNWDTASCYGYNDGFDQTHSVTMTVSVEHPKAYCYVSGWAKTTSGAGGWEAPVGSRATEFSVRQLSIAGMSG